MKRGIIAWVAFLTLGIGLWVGCSDNSSNTFGPSGGGGAGGGAGGNVVSQVLKNGVVGFYNSVTLTVVPVTAGGPAAVTDPISGDTTVYGLALPPSIGTNMTAWLCPSWMGQNCNTSSEPAGCTSPLLWPTYGGLKTWTLEFDLSVSDIPNAVDNVTAFWGPNQAVQQAVAQFGTFPNFVHNTITVSSLLPLVTSPPCKPNNTTPISCFFELVVQAGAATGTAGTLYVDDVKWVH